MERQVRRRPLRAPAPVGWRWVRLTAVASVASLLVTALLAGATVWMKLAEKQAHVVVRLLVVSACLAGLGLFAAVAGKWFELRERRVRFGQEWRASLGRLLRE